MGSSVRLLGASASKPAMGCGGSKAQPASEAESAPEPAPPAPEPSAPPASGGAEEEEVDKVKVDKVDEPLTFSPMAEEASEAGAIPMAANAIRQEAEMAHNE